MKLCEVSARIPQPLQSIAGLVRREDGQDTMEYGLLAALIAPLVIAVILLIGPQLNLYFQNVVNALP